MMVLLGKYCMVKFLNLIASEPDIARNSNDDRFFKMGNFRSGFTSRSGKCVVNSISLKGGEEEFIKQTKAIKDTGAAVIVMAFDENWTNR